MNAKLPYCTIVWARFLKNKVFNANRQNLIEKKYKKQQNRDDIYGDDDHFNVKREKRVLVACRLIENTEIKLYPYTHAQADV